MKAYVIVDESNAAELRSTEDQRVSVFVSKAHAKRVIEWIGLTGRKVREATELEVSAGVLVEAHCVTDWATKAAKELGGRTTPQSVLDFATEIGLAIR